jgi:hypothetical protein
MQRTLAAAIASRLEAMSNCEKTGNAEWLLKHEEAAEKLVRDHMPSGSGVDNGTALDFDASTPDKLIFRTSFHHMDDGGFYAGWTDHAITVRASLVHGITIAIGGRDRNSIKEYLHDIYHQALTALVDG